MGRDIRWRLDKREWTRFGCLGDEKLQRFLVEARMGWGGNGLRGRGRFGIEGCFSACAVFWIQTGMSASPCVALGEEGMSFRLALFLGYRQECL